MSVSEPEFKHLEEYARYGEVQPDFLKKRIAPIYPGELKLLVCSEDAIKAFPFMTQYSSRVRWYIYHHGFLRMDKADGKLHALHALHILSYEASEKLSQVGSPEGAQFVYNLYGRLARYMNHDMLHGFNGEPKYFTEYDEWFIFGGVEFFAVMSHSEIFERWLKRDANGEFLLNMWRAYISHLAPVTDEYKRTKDPELLRLLDYFVFIYQKCLLTLLPLSHEIVLKFNGWVNKMLYGDLLPYQVTREKYERIMDAGLAKWNTKNNPTLSTQEWYDRRRTKAAQAWIDLIHGQFEDSPVDTVPHIVDITFQNLMMWACFRMAPNLERPNDLQNRFQKIYMNK